MTPPRDLQTIRWRDATYSRDQKHFQKFHCTDAVDVLIPNPDQPLVVRQRPWETHLQDCIRNHRLGKKRYRERIGFHGDDLVGVSIMEALPIGYHLACIALERTWRGSGAADGMVKDALDLVRDDGAGPEGVGVYALIHRENTRCKDLLKGHDFNLIGIDTDDPMFEKWEARLGASTKTL